jgi:hypothetical protein
LRDLLESHVPRGRRLRADLLYPGDPALTRPADAYRLIIGHNTLDDMERLVRNPVYLMMLRDPVDRILSLYRYWRSFEDEAVERLDLKGPRLAKAHPLGELLDRDDVEVSTNFRNSQAGQLFQGLRHPVELPEAEFLEEAKRRLDSLFWVGLVERYDASVDLLCHRLGWRTPTAHARKNVTARPPDHSGRTRRSDTPGISDDVLAKLEDQNRVDRALVAHAGERLRRDLENMAAERASGASPRRLRGPLWRNMAWKWARGYLRR